MADYEGMDESTLKALLDKATSYDERSALRKAIRKLKNGPDSRKKVGSANYRRAGYQAPTTVSIPNSVTGNILPNRVNTDHISKVQVPQAKGTISYLKSPRTSTSEQGSLVTSSSAPRGSVSSATDSRKGSLELSNEEREGDNSQHSAGNVTESQVLSPLPPATRTTVNGVTSPQDAEPFSPSPREATPSPPPKDPTPPPREPTPPPPREPTPEPSPPPREPTPEPSPPPREPTPEPSPPPREPTPEPSPSPEPELEEVEQVDAGEEVKEEEEEEDVYEEEEEEEIKLADEEEEEEEEEETEEGVKVDYDSESEEDQRSTSFSPATKERHQYRQTSAEKPTAPVTKSVVPTDVLTKKEEGISDGNFRKKLQKTSNTKINTSSAFPQAKPKGEQVDFRQVLRKGSSDAKKVNIAAAFPQAKQKGEQIDFRTVLRKTDRKDQEPPATAPKRRTQLEEKEERDTRKEEQSPTPEPADDAVNVEEEEGDLSESLGSGAAALEGEDGDEDREVGVSPEVPQGDDDDSKNDQQESKPEDEVETPSPSYQLSNEVKEDSYEARQAERRRRREQRKKELASMVGDTKPVENGTADHSSGDTPATTNATTNGTDEPDSYEARREARRKAREERLKAASARVTEDRPKLSYKEKKALEARKNAQESRKQWEGRNEDEESKGNVKPANFKKKDTATQQLLAWCQHKTKYYENVEIKDFRSSWSNGLAFCAIMHSFLPEKIPYDELTAEDKRRNFTLAFDAAKDAGIPEMLDVEDMLAIKVPDAKSIMTFLVTIYQHFN